MLVPDQPDAATKPLHYGEECIELAPLDRSAVRLTRPSDVDRFEDRVIFVCIQESLGGLDLVGGREWPPPLGILQEGRVMGVFLAQLAGPTGVALDEALAEVVELGLSDLLAPSCLHGRPALLELVVGLLGEMRLGVAPHVHRAELDVGL